MKSVLVAATVALFISLVGTPQAIRLFRKRGFGQEIREDGPQSHLTKRGTPTMGGAVIILATLAGYFVAHLIDMRGVTASAMLVLMVMTGLGIVGFADDFIKIRKQRNLGLSARTKFIGQLAVALAFGLLAVRFRNGDGYLLYSVGENGQDDGGKQRDDAKNGESWDDLAVRMPATRP